MTSENIKKLNTFVREIFFDSKVRRENRTIKIKLYIDPEVNEWNKAAIELSNENNKITSQRNKNIPYPDPVYRKKNISNLTTNDWNLMALELKNQKIKSKENNNLFNDFLQPIT